MAAILSVATGASCLSPTSMTYDITTDIPCNEITSISVTVGTDDQTEQAEPVVVTQNCTPNGTVGAIGTYTVQPSKNKRALVWARFVAAVGKNVDLETDCTAKKNYQGGCVVARRRLTYIPGRELTVPVQLLAQCRDVGCETKSTCNIGGRCETSLLDASKCSASGVCTELSTEELSPSNSTVTVTPGSVAASGSASAEVTVTIRDANNAVMDVSSASVQVTAAPEGMGAWQGTGFVNQAPGVFTRTWLAGTKAGVVNFSGRVDGIILSSPPGRLTQLSGPVVAANSTISVLNPQVIANGTSSTSVVVTLVDAFGNAVNDPNHTVTITATDGQLIDTMKFDEASRSWRQGWVAPASLGVGTVTIQLATVDGQPITGRSTLIRLIAGPVSLDKSVLKVPQRVVTSASTTQIVTLDLRDATGNAVDVSDLTATGVVAPIAGVQRGVLGNGDKFTRTSPGVYSINLTSPASLTGCNGPPFCVDAVSAIVSAPGLNGGMPTAAGTAQRVQYGISPTLGTPAGTLTLVRSAAAAGPGASTLTATLQLQNTAMVPIQVGGDLARIKAATSFITPPLVITDNDNGSYTIAVPSPNLPVSGTLTVTVDNVPVTNGVKTISFYGAPDATQSTLTLSAGTLSGPGSVFAELKLRDANGTPIPELVLPQTSIRFSTTGQATVAGSPVGSITAGASVYTQQISRGPTPTIDFETSVVSAEGLVNGSWVSLGTPQTLTITPQNLAGVTINCSNIATYRNQNLYVDNGTLTIDSWVNGAQPVVGGCSGLGPAPFTFAKLVVAMGGTLTHSVGSNTVANGLDVVVTDLLEVRVGGQINAVSKGIDGDCTAASGSRNIEQFYFANGTIQSGGISYLPSGSHGGTGVRASVTPFGSVSNPNEPGGTAGCGTLSGGVIRLTAKKLVNQGLITASVKGTNAITSYASGGAAGSINIQLSGTDPLTGSGRFLAKGGDGFPAYGAVPGAGGRIAVHGDTSALRLDQFDVRPGNYGGVYDPAGVGTLFFSGPLADYSMIHDVTVSGRDNSSVVPTSAATNWVVPANVTLILTEPSTTATELGDLTVSGEVVTNGPVSLKSLLVRGTGIVHPDVLTSASTSVRPKVDVTASGAITIDEGGQITASGLGFPAFGSTTNPLASCPGGPRPLTAITGAGFDCAPNTGARGGSHSVAGGAETGGFVWGDAAAPATPGGGGSVSTNATSTGGYDPRAGAGGGIIKLSAASLVINGSVTATGESAGATSATRSAGAGAGGSINIAVTGALSSPRSTGVISANGGSATTTTGPVHGGAGGLVKVVAGSRSGTVLVTSQGGAGVAGGTSGASTTPVEQ